MIRILEHAFTLLESLVNTDHPLDTQEAAAVLDISEPEAERILATLVRQGYAARDPQRGTYVLGSRCFELAGLARGTRDLRTAALPYLVELSHGVHETVHLGIYHASDVVYIAQLERSDTADGPIAHIGVRAPGFCVSVGRVLLAYQPPYELDRVLSTQPLPQYTSDTVTNRDALLAELADTCRRGYAINRGSWREGVCGVAAPVRDHSGAVVAGVGCCVPLDRFDDAPDAPLVTATRSTAVQISAALGYRPLAVAQPTV